MAVWWSNNTSKKVLARKKKLAPEENERKLKDSSEPEQIKTASPQPSPTIAATLVYMSEYM